jgi:hypothetical protein
MFFSIGSQELASDLISRNAATEELKGTGVVGDGVPSGGLVDVE